MKLNKNLKRMMDALAYQHAGDYLSFDAKLKVLGVVQEKTDETRKPGDKTGTANNSKPSGRIALLTDGGDHSLHHALEFCSRQQVGLDLLLHGKAVNDEDCVKSIKTDVSKAGIAHQAVILRDGTLNELHDYLLGTANLVYLIASASNPLAGALKQSQASAAELRRIPLVLFE